MIHTIVSLFADIGLDFIHIIIFLVAVAGFAFLLGCLLSSINDFVLKGNDPDHSSDAALFGGTLIGVIVGFIINLALSVHSSVGSAFLTMLGICVGLAILSFGISCLADRRRDKRADSSDSDSSASE